LKEEKSKPEYAELVREKTKLAGEGKAHTEAMRKQIEEGPGVGLTVDYSQLASSKVGMGFTPFGITVIDADQTIFAQVPISVRFGKQGELVQTQPAPLLRDTSRKLIRFRLPQSVTKDGGGEEVGIDPGRWFRRNQPESGTARSKPEGRQSSVALERQRVDRCAH
jgi:hypothetical protein